MNQSYVGIELAVAVGDPVGFVEVGVGSVLVNPVLVVVGERVAVVNHSSVRPELELELKACVGDPVGVVWVGCLVLGAAVGAASLFCCNRRDDLNRLVFGTASRPSIVAIRNAVKHRIKDVNMMAYCAVLIFCVFPLSFTFKYQQLF